MKRLLAAVGLILSLAAGQAPANILYTFSGATLDGGGTLTGSFTTDDAISALLDFDITTSAGAGIGFHYTPATAGSSSTSLPFLLVLSTPTLDNILQVTFDGGLTALGATILLDTFSSFEQTTSARRDITGGEVTAGPTTVPEPATLALLGMAILGVVIGTRRGRA
jgi:hypothetical protein